MPTPVNPPAAGMAEPMPQTGPNAARTPGVTVPPAPSPAAKSGSANRPVTVSGMILNVSPAESSKPAGANVPVRNDRAVVATRKAADVPPGVPRSRLVLHAVQESWADIRDAHDNKLLYENVPAGRSVTIEGVAPFSVFLGNADGVRVEFNGQNFDVSRYKRGQVARFTLGEDTAVNN
jgi:cytoskeleton protein RodZ